MIGQVLSNRYEVLARVGEGGMAVVYRARDTLLGRMVALKVLRSQYASDLEFVERFRREAQTAASLSHPNVVNIYDVGEENGIYYIVMEYVEGRNLKEIIRQEGPLPNRTAVLFAREICRALEAAHRLNLTHRDVKPHNILITFDGRVKVTDFGIARAAAASSLTQTGTVIGSVHYFSPEQARGGPVGTASDIYSLGVLCYEMVTGSVPFSGDSPVAVALMHVQEQPKPPRQLNPQVSAEFERIILKAMAKSEADRYSSATAMLRDLRALGETYGTTAGEDDITQPMTPVDSLAATTVQPALRTEDRSAAEGDRQERKRGMKAWLWLIALASFLGGLLWAGNALPSLLFPEEVRVPSVIGKEVKEAEALLREQGLKLVEERQSFSSSVPVNHIITQDPPGNRRVRVGRNVFVVVSRGLEYVSVPDVIGLTLSETRNRLVQAGLMTGTVREEKRSGSAPGTVLRQNPAGGSRLEKGASVDLVVTEAKQQESIEVPNLRGLTPDEAKSRLGSLGLKTGKTYTEEPTAGVVPGSIIDQNPPPGTMVEVGSSVDFAYADKEGLLTGGFLRLPGTPRDTSINRDVSILVPEGPDTEVVVIVVDDFGTREVHSETASGGATLVVPVKARGDKPVVRVYMDGKLVRELPLR
ncbi:MAG: Stk1 family PASTA domain-containing Ser/Thr kinase [Limnochordia bacterium]